MNEAKEPGSRSSSAMAGSWRAPSGTEAIYKIYAESSKDEQYLQAILADAQRIVGDP